MKVPGLWAHRQASVEDSLNGQAHIGEVGLANLSTPWLVVPKLRTAVPEGAMSNSQECF